MNEEDRRIMSEAVAEWQSIVDDPAERFVDYEVPHDDDEPPGEPVTRPRGRGRPSWPPQVFQRHWREACAVTEPPWTYEKVAANFRLLDGSPGTDPNHLRKLFYKYGDVRDLEPE